MSGGLPAKLTSERKATHGDWNRTARIANRLKLALHEEVHAAGARLTAPQLEALDMIVAKMARIVAGDPSHSDHWDDIAGYAWLGKGGGR
jgi:hypothetical protein